MRWPLQGDRQVEKLTRLQDRYVVETPIGQGRSTVYRGTDTRLGRAVAIKRVPLASDHESGERVRVRALREARAAARLHDPRVVTVYDVLEQDGALWLIMELVEAPSLAQLVNEQGPLDHAHAARIGLDLLSALDTAHGVGVVHRDVKPANVLVPSDGHAKLADFGVATMRDETRVTATGLVLGSPAYMAPEQAKGEQVGPAADLWALGATLYFAYEGEPPFDAGSALATASAVVLGEPRSEERSGSLSPLVARLLTKSPGDRPGAEEVKAELRAVARSDEAPPTAPTVVVPAAEAEVAEPDEPEMPETVSVASVPADDTDAAAQPEPPATEAPAAALLEAPADVPMAPPDQDEPEPRRSPRGRPNRTLTAALVAAIALAVVTLVVLLSNGDSDPPGGDNAADVDEQAETTTTEAADAAAGEDTTDETAATTTTAAPTTTEPPSSNDPAEVPEGWTTYTNEEAGYTVAYPEGWSVEPAGGLRIDFREPETGTYLRVDWTDQPRQDPVADWRAQAPGFASSHREYQEIQIAPYTYRDYTAAAWEFRYTDGGARLHAINVGFVAGEQGYALFFQTKDERWSASQDLFTQIRDSFRPA